MGRGKRERLRLADTTAPRLAPSFRIDTEVKVIAAKYAPKHQAPPAPLPDDGQLRKQPQEWARERGFLIMDPDGWRRPGDPPFDQPLTWEEFEPRFNISTLMPLGPGA